MKWLSSRKLKNTRGQNTPKIGRKGGRKNKKQLKFKLKLELQNDMIK